MKTSVNAPRTPVTKGSNCTCIATVPNVCKMPGPPAPFVPTPLPNIAMSSNALQGATKKVKIEGQPVAIQGASFKSVGDEASQGTGGGIVSSTTQGTCKFVSPGSLDVKAEGKAIHLLGDATTNNNGGSPNAATMAALQAPAPPPVDGPALQDAASEAAAAAVSADPPRPADPAAVTVVLAALAQLSIEVAAHADHGEMRLGVPYSAAGTASGSDTTRSARRQAARDVAAAQASGQPTTGVYAASFAAAGGAPALVADAVVLGDPTAAPDADNVVAAYDVQMQGGSGTTSPARRQRSQDTLGVSPTTVHAEPDGGAA